MPNGRGRGRGFWPYYGTSYGMWPYWGGRGNPYPFCRNFPWLPRWWWASPYAYQYASTVPYLGGYGYPAAPYAGGYGYSPAWPYAGTYAPTQPTATR